MKKIPAFTIPFYEFVCDEQLTKEIFDLSNSQEYIPNVTNKTGKHRLKHPQLINWFNSCLEEVKNDLYDNPTFEIKVTDCWLNKTSYSEKHHPHAHVNSLYSGVFYLTTHHKKATTRFFFHNPFYNLDFSNLFATTEIEITSKKTLIAEIAPISGKLIIFPSQLKHDTTTNINRDSRYTVSFNSFISGVMGADDNLTRLHITTHYDE